MKMQFYSIVTVFVDEQQQICTYDVVKWALNAPIPSTGWIQMHQLCSYYPIKPGNKVNIYISVWKSKIEFNARVVRTHGDRFWFEADNVKEGKNERL